MRTLVVLSVLLFLPISLAEPTSYDATIDAFQKGDYERAVIGLEKLLQTNPDWAPGRVMLGQCYYLSGRPAAGDAAMSEAARIAPDTDLHAAYGAVANKLYDQGRFIDALPALERAIEHASETQVAPLSLRRIDATWRAGDIPGTRERIDTHHERFGPTARSAYLLASTCRELADNECALAGLDLADRFEDDPAQKRSIAALRTRWLFADALNESDASRRTASLERAVEATERWLAADPASCEARELLARTANLLSDATTAERRAREAIDCDPDRPGSRVELATALIGQLRAEHSGIDEIDRDFERAGTAIDLLEQARLLGADAARTEKMLGGLRATSAALEQAKNELLMARAKGRQAAILERCRVLFWRKHHEQIALSAEDESFFREHDCKRLVGG